ncbi:hypothetical protein IW138_003161 [Coemansia sp. RSA 986]|nr:hypothetical protein IW138_003161 [Coemansia sp. RSA 986]
MPDIDLNPSGSASYAILVALFSMPIIQVLVRKSTRRRAILQKLVLTLHCAPQASDSSVTIINCIHAHKLLDMEDRKYIGNPVFMQPVFVPLDYEQYNENTLATAFANVVDHINAGVRSIDAPLLGGLLDTLDENPDTYAKLAISVAMGRPLLTFIDEREYRVGDVDFGCGSPSWVSAPAWNMPNFVAFLACPPGLDGTMVYTSLKDDIFERVSCNILFAKYARFLF